MSQLKAKANGYLGGTLSATLIRIVPIPKFPKGRTCGVCGCQLASDNGSKYCSVHQRYYARTRVRKTKETTC